MYPYYMKRSLTIPSLKLDEYSSHDSTNFVVESQKKIKKNYSPIQVRPSFGLTLDIHSAHNIPIVDEKTVQERMNEYIRELNNPNPKIIEIARDIMNYAYSYKKLHNAKIRRIRDSVFPFVSSHRYKKFDIYPNPKYNMYVYKIRNSAYKIYNYEKSSAADFLILREILWQKYAYSISRNCEMKIPKIKDYGYVQNNKPDDQFPYSCIFLIEMEWMNIPTLDSQRSTIKETGTCEDTAKRLNNVQTCMETNGFYHNDFHHQNVLLGEDGEIGVIDFGRSDVRPVNFENQDKYRCDKDGNLKTKRQKSSKGGKKKTKRHKSKIERIY